MFDLPEPVPDEELEAALTAASGLVVAKLPGRCPARRRKWCPSTW
jgi:hypothetical protein